LVIDHGEELQIIHYKALGDGNRKQGIGNRDGILIVGLKPILNKYVFQGAKHDEKPRSHPNPTFKNVGTVACCPLRSSL